MLSRLPQSSVFVFCCLLLTLLLCMPQPRCFDTRPKPGEIQIRYKTMHSPFVHTVRLRQALSPPASESVCVCMYCFLSACCYSHHQLQQQRVACSFVREKLWTAESVNAGRECIRPRRSVSVSLPSPRCPCSSRLNASPSRHIP